MAGIATVTADSRQQLRDIMEKPANAVERERRIIFEWLGLMQHHGAPTRLLDFTWLDRWASSSHISDARNPKGSLTSVERASGGQRDRQGTRRARRAPSLSLRHRPSGSSPAPRSPARVFVVHPPPFGSIVHR